MCLHPVFGRPFPAAAFFAALVTASDNPIPIADASEDAPRERVVEAVDPDAFVRDELEGSRLPDTGLEGVELGAPLRAAGSDHGLRARPVTFTYDEQNRAVAHDLWPSLSSLALVERDTTLNGGRILVVDAHGPYLQRLDPIVGAPTRSCVHRSWRPGCVVRSVQTPAWSGQIAIDFFKSSSEWSSSWAPEAKASSRASSR